MKVGFTGSQAGMTAIQFGLFLGKMRWLSPTEFHHGDCIGSDFNAHNIVREYFPECIIVIHPPLIHRKRAFCKGDFSYDAAEYLVRNHDIVNMTECLVATPSSNLERLRSGTWATIRYARKMQKPVHIIYT